MIKTQNIQNKNLQKKFYSNGQLAIVAYNNNDEPLAEISIMSDSVELAPDEFILKDYAENKRFVQKLFEAGLIIPTDRLILINSHFCLICKVKS